MLQRIADRRPHTPYSKETAKHHLMLGMCACVCVCLHMCVCMYVTDACNSVFLLILSRTCQTVTETHSGDISSLAQDIYNEIKSLR